MSSPIVIQTTYPAPGHSPAGLAWDGTTIWHADNRAGRIFALDPADPAAAPRRALYCPGNLSGLAWDGRAVWQSLFDQEMVRAIDPVTNDFDQTVILEGQGWLSGVAHDGHYLWVAAQQRGQLLRIDIGSNGAAGDVRSLPAPPSAAVGDIDYHDGRLWAALAGPMRYDDRLGRFEWAGPPAYAVAEIDPADGRVLTRHSAPAFYAGLCWAVGELWLADGAGIHRAALSG
jgi:hypothetical protein